MLLEERSCEILWRGRSWFEGRSDDHEFDVCIRSGRDVERIGLYRLRFFCLFREDDRMASDIDTLEASD